PDRSMEIMVGNLTKERSRDARRNAPLRVAATRYWRYINNARCPQPREDAMSVRLSCPSCNTGFALDALPADRRATCPRCGDVFPVRGGDEETGDRGQGTGKTEDNQPPLATHHSPQPQPQPKRGLSVGKAALVAGAMRSIGLAIG